VLAVRRDASQEEVRHAYHRLAKLWHPDRFMEAPPDLRERAERRTRALNAAYGVIGNPRRRAAYDERDNRVRVSYRPWPAQEGASMGSWGGDETATDSGDEGTGIFFGAIFAIIALMLFLAALNSGQVTIGRFIALGAGIFMSGVAFWCVTQGAALARLANRLVASTPPPRHDPQHAPTHPTTQRNTHAHAHAHRAPASNASPSARDHDASEGDTIADPQDEADARFEQLVDEAVSSIPTEFQTYMNNVVVRVKRDPSARDIAQLAIREHGLLLGLYHGVDLTRQHAPGAPMPEVITIFRRPIELYCHHDPDRIRDQVRRTVLHELAHHFGMDHEDMPDSIR